LAINSTARTSAILKANARQSFSSAMSPSASLPPTRFDRFRLNSWQILCENRAGAK